VKSQTFSFSPFKNIEVLKDGFPIQNPWSGSYNSGQFWPCDLNNDGEDDLLVFDKNSNRVLTFIAEPQNGTFVWIYNSDYEDFIPEMRSWMATADFNCDGKKDLFTQTSIGIKVFKNISASSGPVAFALEADGLFSQGFGGQVNIQVNPYGAPAFTDVDSDGDLDILTFEFSGNTVEYHKNFIRENTGRCDSFILKKDLCVFGFFATKPTCGQIRLNTGCQGQKPGPGDPISPSTARVQHIGSQLSALDLDGDGDKDLLVGDLSCPLLNRLINGGTLQSALITSADTLFPSPNGYVKLNTFPSAYQLDANFDGKMDLIVTPTYFTNYSENFSVNGSKGTYLYANQSNTQIPDYQLAERGFLQDQSIDVGEESTPALADIDADGDNDLFIGNLGLKNGALIQAKIAFYRNIGSSTVPRFSLESEDYLGLSTFFRKRLRPVFEDINEDGAIDFGWISSPGNNSDSTKLSFLINQSQSGQPATFLPLNQAFQFPFVFAEYDCPVFTDIDGDQKKDMLVGKNSGRVQYWKQINSWPSLQYQSVNTNYGNIARAPFANIPNLSISDVDQDGNADLVVGDNSGKIKIYKNFKLNTSNVFPIDSTLYQNLILNLKLFRKWGDFTSPALSDLNGDGFPEMLLGSKGGGINFLVNRLGPNSVQDLEKKSVWQLFPNPNVGSGELNWLGKEVSEITLYNSFGKLISSWSGVEISNEKKVLLPRLNPGIYFIKFSNSAQSQSISLRID